MTSRISHLAIALSLLLGGCASNVAGLDAKHGLAPAAAGLTGNGDDVEIGRTQFRGGNYALAERHFRKAASAPGSDAEAWMGLAAAYDRLGRFGLADRAYGELLKRAGRRPEILNNMGYSQLLRGNPAEARRLLQEAKAGMKDTRIVDANLKLLGS